MVLANQSEDGSEVELINMHDFKPWSLVPVSDTLHDSDNGRLWQW
jgi:hypothetical protein